MEPNVLDISLLVKLAGVPARPIGRCPLVISCELDRFRTSKVLDIFRCTMCTYACRCERRKTFDGRSDRRPQRSTKKGDVARTGKTRKANGDASRLFDERYTAALSLLSASNSQ